MFLSILVCVCKLISIYLSIFDRLVVRMFLSFLACHFVSLFVWEVHNSFVFVPLNLISSSDQSICLAPLNEAFESAPRGTLLLAARIVKQASKALKPGDCLSFLTPRKIFTSAELGLQTMEYSRFAFDLFFQVSFFNFFIIFSQILFFTKQTKSTPIEPFFFLKFHFFIVTAGLSIGSDAPQFLCFRN